MTETYQTFIYKEGIHFKLNTISNIRKDLCEFLTFTNDTINLKQPFVETNNPNEARFFIFPYDIGPYLDSGHKKYINDIIKNLPFIQNHEKQHLITDFADNTTRIDSNITLFKVSLMKYDSKNSIATWYNLPKHSIPHKTNDINNQFRYDVSFVGKLTGQFRQAAISALKTHAQNLRIYINIDTNFYQTETGFYSKIQTKAEKDKRETIFFRSIYDSALIFCPPGIGPNSIRMFEAMRFGRIPIIYDMGTILPLEDIINYNDFCIIIPKKDIMDTGHIINEWIKNKNIGDIKQMGAIAKKAWEKYLNKNKIHTLLKEAIKKFNI